jgi:hypothetical protein
MAADLMAADLMAVDSMAGRMVGNSSSDAYKERKVVEYTYIDEGRMVSQMASQMAS